MIAVPCRSRNLHPAMLRPLAATLLLLTALADLPAQDAAAATKPDAKAQLEAAQKLLKQVTPGVFDLNGIQITASTRELAVTRMRRALGEFIIRGIKTTIPLHQAIMSDPVFIEGKATTAYMEDFMSRTPTDLF